MAITSHQIGTTYGGLAYVESLSSEPGFHPVFSYAAYSETIRTIDGGAASRGSAVIEWYFGFMPVDMFNALRVICPGASASVYLKTLKPDYTTYGYFTAVMLWPPLDTYTFNGKRYVDMRFQFVRPVTYTPPP